MNANVIMRLPGGICYAHGRYIENNCPKHPRCNVDPKHIEYMEEAGLSLETIEYIIGAECYCVCHYPYNSGSYCEHCKGDNKVGNFLRERERLELEVLIQAKLFFGSINRDDTKDLLEATGNLILHENGLT